jgi:hypothetical protein
MIHESGAAYVNQWDTGPDPGTRWRLRCHRCKVLIEVTPLDVLSVLSRPLQGDAGVLARTSAVDVTEPPKLLGPPTVVLVQRTSDNPVDAPELLEKFGICFSYLSQERFTRHADITDHRRYRNAEAIT